MLKAEELFIQFGRCTIFLKFTNVRNVLSFTPSFPKLRTVAGGNFTKVYIVCLLHGRYG